MPAFRGGNKVVEKGLNLAIVRRDSRGDKKKRRQAALFCTTVSAD
jgi:hypothetical protein